MVRVFWGDSTEEISKCQELRFPELGDKEDRREGLITQWRGEPTLKAAGQPRGKL